MNPATCDAACAFFGAKIVEAGLRNGDAVLVRWRLCWNTVLCRQGRITSGSGVHSQGAPTVHLRRYRRLCLRRRHLCRVSTTRKCVVESVMWQTASLNYSWSGYNISTWTVLWREAALAVRCRLPSVATPWDLPHTRTVHYVPIVQFLACSQWKVTAPACSSLSSAGSNCGTAERNFLEMEIRLSIKSEAKSSFS